MAPPVTVVNKGVDPLTSILAAQGGGGGGMFGGQNGLLPLLIGAFLFGGGRGMWGLGGGGHGGGHGDGHFAAEALAAQSIFTPKDTSAQLNTFQSWAQTNAAALAQQCCCSTQQVIAAVNGVSDKLFQTYIAQAQVATAQVNNLQATLTAAATANHDATSAHLNSMEENLNDDVHDVEKLISAGLAAGQLAECQTQNLIQATAANSNQLNAAQFCALAKQLAECCCENRLAIANQNALIEKNTAAIQNQLNMQTCEIRQAISADGQATRALINQNTLADLQAQLADAKSAIRDQSILGAIKTNCHGHHSSNGNGNGGNS
jgi:hypothetical protein